MGEHNTILADSAVWITRGEGSTPLPWIEKGGSRRTTPVVTSRR